MKIRMSLLPLTDSWPLPSEHVTGLDLVAARSEPVVIEPGDYALIPTGIAIAIPPGFEGQIRPLPWLAARHGVTVLNAPGTITADYRGEVQVLLINLGTEPFTVEDGARIAALVVAPVSAIECEWTPRTEWQ